MVHHAQKRPRWYLIGLLIPLIWIIFIGINQYRHSRLLHTPWRFSVLLKTSPLVVVSYDHDEDRLLFIEIPADLVMQVPFGYGPYRADAVSRLAELEKKPELISQSSEDLLGMVIQGYIAGASVIKLDSAQVLRNQIQAAFDLKNSLSFTDSNLGLFDRLVFSWILSHTPSTETSTLSLTTSTGAVRETQLRDNSTVLTPAESAVSTLLEHLLEDEAIRHESVTISIYNTTDTPRVGHRFARVLTNYGANVIEVLSAKPSDIKTCRAFIAPELKERKIVAFLKSEMGCEVRLEKPDGLTQLRIELGELYAKRWQLSH